MLVLITVALDRIVRNTLFSAVRVTTIQIQEKVEEGFYPGGGLITGIAFLLFTYRWALTINRVTGGRGA